MSDDVMAKKAWWHSDLVRVAGSGMMGKVKSDPMDSKYPGKPKYCYFEAHDGSEHTLNIENEAVADAIRKAPKDQTVRITAGGTRDQAYLNVTVGEAPTPPAQDGPPENLWPDDAPAAPPSKPSAPPARLHDAGVVGAALAMTVEAVKGLKAAGIPVDGDAAARIYNTHYIQASHN
ncbi:MAG: hypothetical protein AMXMBFR53_36640 [Gemmatimonadota bacterium]